ncbi:MAG: hypothetical protein ACLSAH_00865 [Bilophila wadsworthia]
MPEDEGAQALLGLCYTLARRQGKPKLCLPRWPPAKARAELAAGLLENSGKNRGLA